LPAREAGGLADDLDLVEQTVRAAGEIAKRYYGGTYKRWSKNKGEPVTEADLAIDRYLHDVLLTARPSYGWISEEGESSEGAERLFIVDPIDGTTAFLKQKPHFSISVAVLEHEKPAVGVVFNPIAEECFTAQIGKGSRLNGNALHVRACSSVEGCRILGAKDMFSHPFWSTAPNTPWPVMQIEQRSSVAYRMSLVAAGVFDAALVLSTKHDWDVAAGDLIVREAGGEVSTYDGAPLRYGTKGALQRSVVCADPVLHGLLLERLRHISL
jgi:myo-inositol-1(or 4)-monophosphatase